MKTWCGLFLFVLCSSMAIVASAQSQTTTQSPQTRTPSQRGDPNKAGAGAEGTPTTEYDPTPKFDMDYFVGEWTYDATVPDSPLGPGGPLSGSETVRNIWDGRFWEITIKGTDADGPYSGKGIVMYQDSFAGQSYARYEITRGIAMLKTGTLGCDLGHTCNMYFETPPFEHNGSTIRLKGRYYLTSPARYRLTTEIAVGTGDYRNLGTIWYAKSETMKPKAIK
jgi:hypothetical protein